MFNAHRMNIATERDELKQQRLTDVFISKSKSSPENENRKDKHYILGRRLILWLSKDLLPFSLVEYKGFQDFWSSLHLDTKLPSRQTISIGALDDMYLCIKNELIKVLGSSGGRQMFTSIL